jgi:transcriptional regulator with XRE-family HTH domain
MLTLNDKEKAALERLSERLSQIRVEKASIRDFSSCIGVSAPTYSKLEKADPTVALGVLVRALNLTGNLQSLDALFEVRAIDMIFSPTPRQRARRRIRIIAPRHRKP